MSKEVKTIYKCDECKKEFQSEKAYLSTPTDPWLILSISGGWYSDFGNFIETNMHCCSPDCAFKTLEKVMEKLKNAVRRFPSVMKVK